jgi:hypothetical protein
MEEIFFFFDTFLFFVQLFSLLIQPHGPELRLCSTLILASILVVHFKLMTDFAIIFFAHIISQRKTKYKNETWTVSRAYFSPHH